MSICYVDLDGELVSRKEYCKRLGYNYNQINCIMRTHNVSFEEAVEESLKPIKKRKWAERIAKDKRLRNIWNHMMDRCYNPKNSNYHRYGGRGIKVQDSWHDYFNFEDDLYESYKNHVEEHGEKDTSIDRFPNNDGNYEINNVRWATQEEQANNTSRNIYLDKGLTLAQISRNIDASYSTVKNRYDRGWSKEEIINTPIQEQISFEDIITSTGENVKELAERIGVSEARIMDRYRNGWSWEKIIETPIINNAIKSPTGETFRQISERTGIPIKTLHCRYDRGWTWDKIINTPLDKGLIAPTGEYIGELSKRIGISVGTIKCRYDRGWTWDEIINTPLGQRRKNNS